MTKTKKEKVNCHPQTAPTDTRDAVENAIDRVKENRNATWETVSNAAPNRVGKWQEVGTHRRLRREG